ncbi:hypothetical protein JZ751_025099 [Albula glossodonta]|uniref:Transmembrane 4 L6 family member 4 n=1 Tax=Albula glossodonta TaxID=121402 RepID=A0A8T2PME0_9TELE|nr:hypothetical protein JZ751_025099 [Albula glossodonta]
MSLCAPCQMIFPALVFLGLKNNDCCGCCGNESCGKRFAMFTSIIFAGVGLVGAGYSCIVSAVAINHGPKCESNSTFTFPFENGNYLSDHGLWTKCEGPDRIVPWHLTLFSLLLIMGLIQVLLCAFQVINGLIGTICGDCCGCCGFLLSHADALALQLDPLQPHLLLVLLLGGQGQFSPRLGCDMAMDRCCTGAGATGPRTEDSGDDVIAPPPFPQATPVELTTVSLPAGKPLVGIGEGGPCCQKIQELQ